MSDSILQVNKIKDKGGNATGITVADSSANVTIGNLTATSLAGGTIASAVNFPAGHVLQVLQTIKTDTESVTGTSTTNGFAFVPAQGGSGVFQAEITTSGSNKVLVDVRMNTANSTSDGSNGYSTFWAMFRGAATDTAIGSCTKIAVGTEPVNTSQSTASGYDAVFGGRQVTSTSMIWLDAPSAGTHFYKIGWQSENGGTGYINRSGSHTNAAYYAQVPSTLTLYEVQV